MKRKLKEFTTKQRETKKKKYKATQTWNQYRPILTAQGFPASLVDRIILRKSSTPTVKYLCKSLKSLLSIGLNYEQITKLAAKNGESKNLKAFQECFINLKLYGISINKIEEISAHGGGLRTYTLFKNALPAYKPLTFHLIKLYK